ncbi:hypothetical protein V6N11_061967 [Hibiscus sabdariffa]|uniref:Proteasome subunit alpha type-3 n=1 Tax=Hibiscus sabdariffa TaxID=183260 RepID=A0ABR2PR54_9ROSI
MAVAGLAADGRQIVARAKSEATITKAYMVSLFLPFGCGIILGGYDRDGPQLYMVEPSGISYKYFGAAIGKGKQAAKTEIEKLKLSEMTCREGVIEVAKIIYKVHDEAKDKAFELEMSWVCEESKQQHQKFLKIQWGCLEFRKNWGKCNLYAKATFTHGLFSSEIPNMFLKLCTPPNLEKQFFGLFVPWRLEHILSYRVIFPLDNILYKRLSPDDLLEEAKAAARTALEEMDAD